MEQLERQHGYATEDVERAKSELEKMVETGTKASTRKAKKKLRDAKSALKEINKDSICVAKYELHTAKLGVADLQEELILAKSGVRFWTRRLKHAKKGEGI